MALLSASILVAELGDLHRFETAGQLMSYLGLVPSEDTTGGDRKQGGLTKMGNGFARRALIEAAWNYRAPARISRTVLARQEGLPQAVLVAAWTAQTRLHARYKHLTRVRPKKSTVAAAALGMRNSTVRLHDAMAGAALRRFTGHLGEVFARHRRFVLR